jgi:hypothetical protein
MPDLAVHTNGIGVLLFRESQYPATCPFELMAYAELRVSPGKTPNPVM